MAIVAEVRRNIIIRIERINFEDFPPTNSAISIISEFEKFLKILETILQNISKITPKNSIFTMLPVPR
jgi:hypothetical protein